MSPIDQKTRPLKENHLIQRVLHRPVELAPLLGNWPRIQRAGSPAPTISSFWARRLEFWAGDSTDPAARKQGRFLGQSEVFGQVQPNPSGSRSVLDNCLDCNLG